eukprot:XP_001705496.1 Hypothetical protein GL50803_24204 [Giardia lamblia ATCC 50803]
MCTISTRSISKQHMIPSVLNNCRCTLQPAIDALKVNYFRLFSG